MPLRRGSSTLPLVTTIAGAAGAQLAFIRPACPARYRGLQLKDRRGWASAHRSLISLDRRVRPPDPPLETTGYANRQSGQVESLVILWVRLPPRSLTTRSRGPAAKTPGDIQENDGSTPSGITLTKKWSVGVSAAHLRGKAETGFDSRTDLLKTGWLVQREGRLGLPGNRGSTPRRSTETTGSWSNGKTPARQAGNPGSIPGGSTEIRKVAGYGLPGRFAKPCDLTGHVGSNPMPSAAWKTARW